MIKKLLISTVFFSIAIICYSQCPVSVSITANPTGSLCKNTSVKFTANPTNGGSNPQYYWIMGGDTVGNGTSFTTSINWANVGLIMISNSGCPQDSAYSSSSINTISLQASYQVIIEECNQPKADVQITNVQGGTPPYTYYLQTDNGQISGTDYMQDVPVSSYPLIITDSEGCQDTTWVDVNAIECPPIIPQEVFTPNSDGYNDTWTINNIQFYPKNKVYIFDRWGQRVFYKSGYTNTEGWDAKYMAVDMPVSTYYYIIELEFEKQETIIKNGPVSILR